MDIRNRDTELGERIWRSVAETAAEGWLQRWEQAEDPRAVIERIHTSAPHSPEKVQRVLQKASPQQLDTLTQEDFERFLSSSHRGLREAALRAARRVGMKPGREPDDRRGR